MTDVASDASATSSAPAATKLEVDAIAEMSEDKRSAVDRVASKPRHWTPVEDEKLKYAVVKYGEKKWKEIALHVGNRNHTQCFQRWHKVLCPGLKKGRWSEIEDEKLMELALEHLDPKSQESGQPKINWGIVAKQIPGRTAKQCRERWVNNLNPEIVRGNWSAEEDKVILELSERFPKKWALMAKQLKGRTENAVKIRFYSLMRKRKRMSQGGRGASGSSSKSSIKKEKLSPNSAKNQTNGGHNVFPHNGLSQLSSTALKMQQGIPGMTQNGSVKGNQGIVQSSQSNPQNTFVPANPMLHPGSVSPQGLFLHPHILQQQQQQQHHQQQQQQQSQQVSPSQQRPNNSDEVRNPNLQVQQALILIQQNEQQIQLLQQQTEVLKRVVAENRMAAGVPGSGGSNDVAAVLNDESKREKLFHLLCTYFRKHEMDTASDEAISKVIDWTREHGFEALNKKLQAKHGESFNEFIVSMIEDQRRSHSTQQTRMSPNMKSNAQGPNQQPQQIQQLPVHQQQVPHQMQHPPGQQVHQSQKQPQQPHAMQHPQQYPTHQQQMAMHANVRQQQPSASMGPQPNSGLSPAQMQQINMARQAQNAFSNMHGQQLLPPQAFMQFLSAAPGRENQKQEPMYAVPMHLMQQAQQDHQQLQQQQLHHHRQQQQSQQQHRHQQQQAQQPQQQQQQQPQQQQQQNQQQQTNQHPSPEMYAQFNMGHAPLAMYRSQQALPYSGQTPDKK